MLWLRTIPGHASPRLPVTGHVAEAGLTWASAQLTDTQVHHRASNSHTTMHFGFQFLQSTTPLILLSFP
eukprot:5229523-Amphidinium_carterae.1